MSSPAQESGLLLCDLSEEKSQSDRKNNDNNTTAESSDSDNDTPKNRPPAFALRMLNLCKEITIMALIAVVYAALTNENPPKVSKSPAAYPFFPKNSLITDWYRGQITEAIEDARSSDIAFVMFYAPWDAASQSARKQFELTAEFMHDQVSFAGINCWQPGSECKRQYSKVYKWPVLIAYPTHGRGIQYNGPLDAFHMIKFLQNVCKPLVRPRTVQELYGKYDTVVTGNVNMLPGSYEYAVFYSTALRFLERDPFRDIVFAVLPSVNDSASIQLHLWNGTIEYDGEWNPESLINWISKNLQQIVSWVVPTGVKSLTMSNFIQPGPTLILFTPKNPLHSTVDLYNMLREVAYEYYNCANDTKLATKQKLIRLERLKSRESYEQLKRTCLQEKPKEIVTSLPNVWSNNTLENICNCVNIESSTTCHETDDQITHSDKLSAAYLQRSVTELECRQAFLAKQYAPLIFEKTLSNDFNISGLACKTNLTLTFVALDSLRSYHFAEKLGIGLVESSGLAIVDEKMETHHVLENRLDGTNVRFFVRNFTQRTLSRSLRSSVRLKTKHQHVYPHLSCSKQENLYCVEELTSGNFLDRIMKSNQVVVVFYYSKQCAFCSGIGHVFLTVAKTLSNIKEISFVRIDGDINLLPWEFTMETYPTILFIPARRKSESRIFPKNLQVSVPNLVGFVLTNVEPVLKLKTMWFLCSQAKFVDEKVKCIASVRSEVLTTINKTLKEWRSSKQKHKILRKLQVLRHLHLLLAHSPDKTLDIEASLCKLR